MVGVVTRPAQELTTSRASRRGERLRPRRSSRVYYVLTQLRNELTRVADTYFRTTRTPKAVLVDFGCGNMPYRPVFEPLVDRYVGCDLPGNEMADLILPAPDSLPIEAGAADVVLSSQVLEHVVDVGRYLGECRRVLSDQGLLILSTHGVWQYHPDPNDFWRWTSQGLMRQVEQAGFKVERLTGVLGPGAAGLQLFQDAVYSRLPRIMRSCFAFGMQLLISVADRVLGASARNRDASVYVVVARKRGFEEHP
jgi:SAM-dependent methyltransferase